MSLISKETLIDAIVNSESNISHEELYNPLMLTGSAYRQNEIIDIIKQQLDVISDWIQVKYHVMNDEEREENLFSDDISYMLDCRMPDDEQEILIATKYGVEKDICYIEDGYSLDSGYDWIEDVVAWMPLPKYERTE